MLTPALAVSLVGIAVATVGITRGRPASTTLRCGLRGPWLGFVACPVSRATFDLLLERSARGALSALIAAVVRAAPSVAVRPAAAVIRWRPAQSTLSILTSPNPGRAAAPGFARSPDLRLPSPVDDVAPGQPIVPAALLSEGGLRGARPAI
jgi:hypothetical protein